MWEQKKNLKKTPSKPKNKQKTLFENSSNKKFTLQFNNMWTDLQHINKSRIMKCISKKEVEVIFEKKIDYFYKNLFYMALGKMTEFF